MEYLDLYSLYNINETLLTADEWDYFTVRKEFKKYKNNFEKMLFGKEDKCFACGVDGNIHYHHVVPLSLGGVNNPFNLVRLCEDCHNKLHGIKKVDSYRKYGIYQKDEKLKKMAEGRFCFNCLGKDDLSGYLIVPETIGGTLGNGNVAILCSQCRAKVESAVDEHGIISQSALTKIGMKHAKSSGKTLGKPSNKRLENAYNLLLETGFDYQLVSEVTGLLLDTIIKYSMERRLDSYPTYKNNLAKCA